MYDTFSVSNRRIIQPVIKIQLKTLLLWWYGGAWEQLTHQKGPHQCWKVCTGLKTACTHIHTAPCSRHTLTYCKYNRTYQGLHQIVHGIQTKNTRFHHVTLYLEMRLILYFMISGVILLIMQHSADINASVAPGLGRHSIGSNGVGPMSYSRSEVIHGSCNSEIPRLRISRLCVEILRVKRRHTTRTNFELQEQISVKRFK